MCCRADSDLEGRGEKRERRGEEGVVEGLVGVDESISVVEGAERAVGLYTCEEVVDEGEEVFARLLHEGADLAVVERCGQERCGEAGVRGDVVGRFGDLRYHNICGAVGDEGGDLLVFRVDGDRGVRKVLEGELLVEAAGVDHDADVGLVDSARERKRSASAALQRIVLPLAR